MKKVIVLVVMCIMMSVTVSAKVLECEVVATSTTQKADVSAVLINCDVDAGLNKGDKIKVRVVKNTTAIEGC